MTDSDRDIMQALYDEDAELLGQLAGDESLYTQVMNTFTGRQRWLNALGWVAGFALFGAAAFTGWRFANASDVADMLRWGAASGLAFAGLSLIKVWFWLDLQRNALARDVKRLELRIANLSHQFRDRPPAGIPAPR